MKKLSIKSFKPSIKIPLAEEQVNQKIKSEIKKQTKKEIDKIVKEISGKTIIYFVLSIVGLVLLLVPFPPVIFYILFFVMMPIVFYLLAEFVKIVKKVFHFVEHFDSNIKAIVENKMKAEKGKSLKNLIGFQLSGHNSESIENLFISYSVKELVNRFKKEKKMIVTRITAYTVTVILFSKIFPEIFTEIFKTFN